MEEREEEEEVGGWGKDGEMYGAQVQYQAKQVSSSAVGVYVDGHDKTRHRQRHRHDVVWAGRCSPVNKDNVLCGAMYQINNYCDPPNRKHTNRVGQVGRQESLGTAVASVWLNGWTI